MLSRVSDRLALFCRSIAPDPFSIAVLLTLLTFLLAVTQTATPAIRVLDAWAGADPSNPGILSTSGLWKLLAFAMQMCLILVLGHAVAESRPVSAVLRSLARLPRSPAQAIALVALVAALTGLINWGLGLIAGAIIARRVGIAMRDKGIRVHYPLLAAAGYVGLLVWHGGISGTAPLKVTTEKDLTELLSKTSLHIDPIPIDQTLLSPLNFIATGGLVILCPIILALMHPRREERIETIDRFIPDQPPEPPHEEKLPLIPRLLEETPLINLLLAAMIAIWAWRYYTHAGALHLTPDSVNLTMLLAALLLHATPRRFLTAVDQAASGCGGIIVQFPLYAGIAAMMEASGLTQLMATNIAGHATPSTLPVLTFLAACVVGLFIPSGGAQWAVQGPVAIGSALQLGVAPSTIVMSIAYGDELANMTQPFWALPLLAVTGVKARDIIGYTILLMLISTLWISACLLIF